MAVFSIIVPVYKVELYLAQCVDSILSQTYSDFELLLIDDGSPDNCGAICDRYAAKDARVQVIHKENGGPSSARNYGMEIATGKYILFIDSDDYWDRKDALAQIFAAFADEEADVVLLKHRKLDMQTGMLSENTNPGSNTEITGVPYSDQLAYSVSQQLFDACAWNKAFRRSLMIKNDLFFVQGIIAEDLDWAARLSLAARKLAVVDAPVYIYRKGRPGAITTSLKLKNLVDTREGIERCLGYVSGCEYDAVFLKAYFGYLAYRYVIWMAESAVVKDPGKKEHIHAMKQYIWLLKYDLNRKVRLARMLTRITGFALASKLLGLYLKSKR